MVDSLPRRYQTPEIRVSCPDEKKFEVIESISKELKQRHRVIDIDGARVLFEDGWGLVRASNTQPVLVLRFEAETADGLERIKGRFKEILSRYPSVNLSGVL